LFLLLDVDGVLQFKHPQNEPRLVAKHAIDSDFIKFQQRLFSDPEYSAALVGERGFVPLLQRNLSAAGIDADAEAFMKEWLMGAIVQNRSFLDCISRMRTAATCLATNQEPVRGAHIAEHYARFPFIDRMFISHEMGFRKPDLEFFRFILGALPASPDQVVFVDDHPLNVQAAAGVGIHAIRFESNEQALAELDRLGLSTPS
jgi:putative hydrolase of the HAD superfamily